MYVLNIDLILFHTVSFFIANIPQNTACFQTESREYMLVIYKLFNTCNKHKSFKFNFKLKGKEQTMNIYIVAGLSYFLH
jgi:hypothetical protein